MSSRLSRSRSRSWCSAAIRSCSMRIWPADFMFQLTAAEWAVLRSQFVTSKPQRGGRRYAPYVFTEQGVAMLSSVLGSERAIAINIEIMRAFVKLRDLLSSLCATGDTAG
jgi:ORF6N domain